MLIFQRLRKRCAQVLLPQRKRGISLNFENSGASAQEKIRRTIHQKTIISTKYILNQSWTQRLFRD